MPCALRCAPTALLRPLVRGDLRACARRGLCTFAASGTRYVAQPYYTCACNGHAEGSAICAACAAHCHAGAGHDLRRHPSGAGAGTGTGAGAGAGAEGYLRCWVARLSFKGY
mgnify:CR=1 FL=1